MRLTSILACAAAAPLLAAASQPVRLQPSSPWVVDYAEDSCRLIRTFGEGKNKTVLAFESEAPEHMDLLVVGRPIEDDQPSDRVPGRFLPGGDKPLLGKAAQSAESGAPGVLWSNVPLLPDALIVTLEKEALARSRISKPGTRPPPIDLAERRRSKLLARTLHRR